MKLANGSHDSSSSTSAQSGYMSIREAAKWAGVSPKTVERWFKKGLPRYQAGPRERVLVRPEDIGAFLEKKQVLQPNLDRLVEEVMQGLGSKR